MLHIYFEKAPQVTITSKGKNDYLAQLYITYDKTSYHEVTYQKGKKDERTWRPVP